MELETGVAIFHNLIQTWILFGSIWTQGKILELNNIVSRLCGNDRVDEVPEGFAFEFSIYFSTRLAAYLFPKSEADLSLGRATKHVARDACDWGRKIFAF